ncbi:MAG: hypothetical protein JHC38_02020, partial [Thiotrichales bacterium]|nr:hypothetical protein [Thiotrichales bacterium]
SGLLTADTQKAIEESFQAAITAKEVEIAERYTQKFNEAKAELAATMTQMVEEAVAEEIQAITEEINHARTLEVQYAEKLQMFKEAYDTKHQEEMKIAVAEAVAEEMEAIAEDIQAMKKFEFAMSIFESYKGAYEKLFGGSDITAVEALEEANRELEGFRRQAKINELLEAFTGSKREVALTILESTATDKLEEKFNSVKHILLAESVETVSEPQTVIESADQQGAEVAGTVVLENGADDANQEAEVVQEAVDPMTLKLQRSLAFAGVRK